jgi:hypothetical protein
MQSGNRHRAAALALDQRQTAGIGRRRWRAKIDESAAGENEGRAVKNACWRRYLAKFGYRWGRKKKPL